jgi:mono/diheme cytochrome c family protein
MNLIHSTLLRACAVGLIAMATPFATVSAAPVAESAQPANDPMTFARGAQAWADTCARCHNFRDPREFSDVQWRAVMLHMRIRANLSGQQARDILGFLQGSNDPAAVMFAPTMAASTSATAVAGPGTEPAVLFNQTCVACHGANGKGALAGIPDFTSAQGPLARKTDAQLAESILNGLQTPGAAMAMPAQGGNPAVTESDAAALAHYLRAQFYGGSR